MRKTPLQVLLMIALSSGLGCQGGEEAPAPADQPEAAVAPDRPAPAISDPASPTPVGTDVGSVERDTSGAPVANDSMARPGR